MKNGKNLTRSQKIFLTRCGFNPAEWLMVKNLSNGTLVVIHRETKTVRELAIAE